jgi:flagellar hook-associated protein 3 FlgL
MRVSSNQYQQTSLQAILDQQARLSKIQQQVATGRRILTPSDDPAGSARALELAKSIETIERYSRNADFAESRMRVEEGVLDQVGNVITRLRELAVQANNASVSAADRQSIAAEVRQRLDQLVELANSTDGNGEYLFAGGQSRSRPFVRVDGEVAYEGDQTTRYIQVGPGRQMATTHSGFEVFMKIPNGSDGFVVSADSGNSGSGIVSGVNMADAAATPTPPYVIEIQDDGAGGLEYTATSGDPPVTTAPQPFREGEPIEIDGLAITVDGTPDSGDAFTIAASSAQSLFETVDRFADALEGGGDGAMADAAYLNVGNRTLEDLDSALDSLLQIRAELGGRMNALESEKNANEVAVLELKTTKSEIEDLDYASAITELNLRLTGLQAAQQSYAKIQGLSLFNYL